MVIASGLSLIHSTALIFETQISFLTFYEELLMEKKLVVMASCLAGAISATTMPLSAM